MNTKHIKLGIDAGGTYTDSVLLDEKNNILQYSKELTSYPNPIYGIKNGLDKLDKTTLKKVSSVFISTTLSTNTILENKGSKIGLVIIGKYEIPDKIPVDYFCIVNGGHDINGNEVEKLDIDSIIEFAKNVSNKVSGFAVSSIFSNRNSSHELKAKNTIIEMLNMPVVCGHELSQSLGAYDRAITAYLNAQLIHVTNIFINSVKKELKERNIDANILITKCDGSSVEINEASKKPIETIFSGPSASLIGASFLLNKKSAIVVDIGGTSTDIARIIDGIPEINENGTLVGTLRTHVKAINMKTIAIGGDSHVYLSPLKNNTFTIGIGPIRVIPLCVASSIYSSFLNKLNNTRKPPRKYTNSIISKTTFYIRYFEDSISLNSIEKKHFYAIYLNRPTSWEDIKTNLNGMPLVSVISSLIEKKMIEVIGFTPTDASVVLNEIEKWRDYNSASIIGANYISSFFNSDSITFSKNVKDKIAKEMSRGIIEYILNSNKKNCIDDVFLSRKYIKYKLLLPIILIGGPSEIYKNCIKEYIDGIIKTSKYSMIGNAIGSTVCKRMKTIDVLIQKYHDKNNGNNIKYLTFYNGNKNEFSNYESAYNYSYELGISEIKNYFIKINIKNPEIKIKTDNNDNKYDNHDTILKFIGIGNIKTINTNKKY